MLIQILITGFVKGGIYAVLVAGLSLMFGVARILNLSYTGFFMLTAYMVYIFSNYTSVPLIIACPLSILITTILGVVSYRLIIDRVKAHELTVMIISLALAMFFQEILLIVFSGDFRGIPPFQEGFFELGGVRVSYQKILTIIVSVGVIGTLEFLLNRTRLGVAIRAVAQDRETANLMGINVNRICLITTGIAMALAGIAGVMVSPLLPLEPHMWIPPLLVILAAIVLGGLGSLKGSIIAAFILGYVETLVVFLIPLGAYLQGAFVLAVMAAVLIIRPEGLYGLVFEEERL